MAAPTLVGTATNQSSTSTTLSCTLPAGAQAGDSVYAWVAARAGGVSTAGYTINPPAGYGPVGIGAHDSQFVTAQCFVKDLLAADASTGDFTFSGGTSAPSTDMLVIVVRGAQAEDQIVYANSSGTGATSLPCSTATTGADNELLLMFAAQSQSSTYTGVNNGAAIQTQDNNPTGSNISVAVAASTLASAGATGVTTFTTSGSGRWVTLTLTITPPSGGSPQTSTSIQFGWGEGHMDGMGSGTLADAMATMTYVFPTGSTVRSNMTKTKSSIGNLTNASWTYLDPLLTAISKAGMVWYPTFSLTNTAPVASTTAELAAWRQMITSGWTYLLSKTTGSTAIPGFVFPTHCEIINEPGNQSTGGGGLMTATQCYVMIREAAIATQAWAQTNGKTIIVEGPGIAGAGNYTSPVKVANDARDYARQICAAARADGHYLSDFIRNMNFHTYFPTVDPLTDPGAGNGHTQYPKSMDYVRADFDAAGLQLTGSHPLYIGITEGGYQDNDFHNQWTGSGPGFVYETEAQRVSDAKSGSISSEAKLPVAWNYWVSNAARLGIVRISQYYFTTTFAYNSATDRSELALSRHAPGTSLVHRAKSTALKNYLANLTVAPSVTIISPTDGTTVTGSSCTLKVAASDSAGLASVQYNLNSGGWVNMGLVGANYQATLVLTLGTIGTTHANTIGVRATGADSGATVTTLPNITVNALNPDTTPPVLTVTTPAANANVANGVTTQSVVGVATDNVGLSTVKVNGVTQTVDGSGNFSTSVGLAVGPNPITTVATDTSGLTTTITRTITRTQASGDTTPPALTVSTPSADATVGNGVTTQAVVGVTTDASGILSCKVNGVTQSLDGGGNFTATPVALSVGANTITVVSTDNSANANTTTITRTITRSAAVDTTPPTLTVSAPTNNQLVVGQGGDSFTVIGQATDASGIASVTVNGLPQALDGSGNFTAGITMNVGPNTVVVVATDASPAANATTITRTLNLSTSGGGTPGDVLIISDDLNVLGLQFKQRGLT